MINMKEKKKDIINVIILICYVLIFVILMTKFFNYNYGSTVDWDCQHWNIPDYFRKLFYDTGNIINDFAPNLGDGQNIFNFSYYGYLSPLILLSYLLPFIPMKIYIEGISVLGLIASVLAFYYWIRKKHTIKISFWTSLLFISSSALLFHSHRHVMFIGYMPFLILGLCEIDKNFEKEIPTLNPKLILLIFLVIMCNYFFSVCAIFSLTAYEFYKIFTKYSKKDIKKIKKELIRFIGSGIIAAMMSSVLLIPTLSVLLNGRASSNVDLNLISLFIPTYKINNILYSAYSPGITLLSLMAVFFNCFNKKNRLLSFIILLSLFLPLVSFVLNGTMYTDSKVLIPLLPLISYLVAEFISDIKKFTSVKNNKYAYLLVAVVSMILIILNITSNTGIFLLIDLITIIITFFIIRKKEALIFAYIFIIVLVITLVNLNSDKLELRTYNNIVNQVDTLPSSKDDYNYRVSVDQKELLNINNVKDINFNLGTVYSSVENKYYRDYYYNFGNEVSHRSYGKVASTKNILYNIVNSNKYMISDKDNIFGYEATTNKNIFENKNTLTIARANLKKMNSKSYSKLAFPYNMEVLSEYVISDEPKEDEYSSNIKEYNDNIHIIKDNTITNISEMNRKKIPFNLSSKKKINFELEGINDNDILFISFKVDELKENKNDVNIRINNITNVISVQNWKYHNRNTSFHYIISNSNGKLDVSLGKGVYEISDIKIYKLDYYDYIESISDIKKIDLKLNNSKNIIKGTYESEKEDILYLQIPYDNGFKINNNGKQVEYININNGLIGFNIEKGSNNFEIIFNAPLLAESKIISMVGFALFITTIFFNKKRKKLLIIKKK